MLQLWDVIYYENPVMTPSQEKNELSYSSKYVHIFPHLSFRVLYQHYSKDEKEENDQT